MEEFNYIFNYREPGYEESIRKVYEEDYIGKHMSLQNLYDKYGYKSFWDAFKKYGLYIRNNREKSLKYTCNSHFFDIIDNEEKAYWLGFMYADGYIQSQRQGYNKRVGITLEHSDIGHLEKFKNSLKCDAPIHTYVSSYGYSDNTKYSRIIISDPLLAKGLINAGCVEHKTDVIKFPSEKILPSHLTKHFIRGYFDGDGSIYYCGGQYFIKICGTDDILDGIMNDLLKNNVITRTYPKYKRKEGQIVSNIGFGGNRLTQKFVHYIQDEATVWLERKRKICLSVDDTVKEVEEYVESKKVPKKCEICGDENSKEYYWWHGNDEYAGKAVCGRHYQQLRKNGKITYISNRYSDKKDYCEYCGDTYGKMITVRNKYPDYYGKTVCRRHYDQIIRHGKIIDDKPTIHKNVKQNNKTT